MIITKILLFAISLIYIQNPVGMHPQITDPVTQAGPVYLAKTDPIYIEIKARAISDWEFAAARAMPDSPEMKIKLKEVASWPKAKQEKLQAFGMQSLEEYNKQTNFDLAYFLMIFNEIKTPEIKKSAVNADFRVWVSGKNKYVAEFWEDLLVANSEENAIRWAKELKESPRAKMHPEEDLGNVEEIKKTYADQRKRILSGKEKRYTQLMAFLYVTDKNKKISFVDPGQAMFDFK
jgi:NAD-specific glutamate dehydrogenase